MSAMAPLVEETAATPVAEIEMARLTPRRMMSLKFKDH
jgi:hypothetical protein